MIRHIVMFKFLPEAEGRTARENAVIAKEKLDALYGVVPTLKNSTVSLNSSEADQSNYDLVLIADFDDIDALNAYQVHPEHKKAGAFIGTVRESRACVDFEI